MLRPRSIHPVISFLTAGSPCTLCVRRFERGSWTPPRTALPLRKRWQGASHPSHDPGPACHLRARRGGRGGRRGRIQTLIPARPATFAPVGAAEVAGQGACRPCYDPSCHLRARRGGRGGKTCRIRPRQATPTATIVASGGRRRGPAPGAVRRSGRRGGRRARPSGRASRPRTRRAPIPLRAAPCPPRCRRRPGRG